MYVHVVAAPDVSTRYACLLFLVPVSAGYPSPTDDYLDGSLDLNQHLIKHPTATFFVRVAGESIPLPSAGGSTARGCGPSLARERGVRKRCRPLEGAAGHSRPPPSPGGEDCQDY